jgi:hypothetical protein
MKNIHVIKTDKPSRLYLGNNGNFVFGMIQTSIQSRNDDFTNQNIYITNDEEIKEGDAYLTKNGEICKSHNGSKILLFKTDKKIILTTDQELIKDGVQGIDNEFLEWFVKNQSCEEVEIQLEVGSLRWSHSKSTYKIIIPKEELKQESGKE